MSTKGAKRQDNCTFQQKVNLGLPGPKIKRAEKHQTGGARDAGSARPLFSFILRKGEYKQHTRKLRNEDGGNYVTSLFRGFWRKNRMMYKRAISLKNT